MLFRVINSFAANTKFESAVSHKKNFLHRLQKL